LQHAPIAPTNDPAIAKLMKALHSPETRQFILDKYKVAVVPAF